MAHMRAPCGPSDLISGTYEDLAAEYYDAVRHPTCANFREASSYVLGPWLATRVPPRATIYDVGAGRSLVAELAGSDRDLDGLVLVDSSPTMLAYSIEWVKRGARLVEAPAERLPAAAESVDALVASLGDPYNTPEFWAEAQRVVRPGGRVFFTTPSHEWAVAFRTRDDGESALTRAEFELADGRRIAVLSHILAVGAQVTLIERAGFVVDEIAGVRLDALTATPVSGKLLVARGSAAAIVYGYHVTKRAPSRQRHG